MIVLLVETGPPHAHHYRHRSTHCAKCSRACVHTRLSGIGLTEEERASAAEALAAEEEARLAKSADEKAARAQKELEKLQKKSKKQKDRQKMFDAIHIPKLHVCARTQGGSRLLK